MNIHHFMLIFGAVSTLLGLVLLLERNLPRQLGDSEIDESLWKCVEGCCTSFGFFAAVWVLLHSEELSFTSPDAEQSLRIWLVIAGGLMFAVCRMVYLAAMRWKANWRKVSGW